MQILNRLTIRNLKLNKRRTIVTIIGIILATALLTAVATMAVSLKESVTLRSKKVDGDFHLLLYDMTDKEKESVINNIMKHTKLAMECLTDVLMTANHMFI